MIPAGRQFLGRIAGWASRRRATVIAGAGTLALSPYALVAGAPLQLSAATAQHGKPSPGLLKLLGPTGTYPGDPQLAPGTRAQAGDPPPPPTIGQSPRDMPHGKFGIPGIVLQAYQRAEQRLGTDQPGCHLPWSLLAGVGKVESNHADDGYVDGAGRTRRPILGPVLNGSHGFAAIRDTDGGKWDGDRTWDRAVGPMQFIPASWRRWAAAGGDPDNVYDSAVAAGRYLCAGGRDLSVPGQQADAVFAYNHSDSYVKLVLSWAHSYAGGGVVPIPVRDTPPPPSQGGLAHNPGGPGGTGSGHGGGKKPGHKKPGPIKVGPQPTHGGRPTVPGGGGTGSTTPPATHTESPTPTETTESPTPTDTETPTPTDTPTTTDGSSGASGGGA
jgi:hypothetical protein